MSVKESGQVSEDDDWTFQEQVWKVQTRVENEANSCLSHFYPQASDCFHTKMTDSASNCCTQAQVQLWVLIVPQLILSWSNSLTKHIHRNISDPIKRPPFYSFTWLSILYSQPLNLYPLLCAFNLFTLSLQPQNQTVKVSFPMLSAANDHLNTGPTWTHTP